MTFAHLPAQTPGAGPRTPGAETSHSVAGHLFDSRTMRALRPPAALSCGRGFLFPASRMVN